MIEGVVVDSLDLTPASTLGQYRIRGRIGSGGMGDVYDAVHTALDKRVAIKTLRRRYLDDEVVVARFLREGQLASRIRHPNIVDVTDVGLIDELPCLVMEHLEGETLSALVKRGGAVPLTTLVDLLLPIVAALDFAHQHGVLHRDLKPSNIFLSRSWNGEITPKVLDFGISKLVEGDDPGLTTDSAFVGTPHYASPESMRGEKMDHRADQYSMGVVIYETATGTRPFAEKGFAFGALALAICNGDFAPPRKVRPELPEAFERVVLRAMASQASARFASMRELGEALLPFASERARVIWRPSFTAPPSSEPPHRAETAVMLVRPSAPTPRPGAPAVGSVSTSGSPSHGFLSSGAVQAIPSPAGGFHPSATPPPMLDRTPSYSLGSGVPMHALHAAPRKTPILAIVAAVGASLCVVAVVAVVTTRASVRRAAAEDAPAASASASPAPKSDRWSAEVHVTPEGAVLEVDGAVAGTGYLATTFPRDGRKHVLRVAAAGYESLLVPFDEDHPLPTRLALRPTSNGATKPPPAAPPPPRGGPPPKTTPGRPKTDNIDPWE